MYSKWLNLFTKSLFSSIKTGTLSIELPNGKNLDIQGKDPSMLSANLQIRDWQVLPLTVFKGGIGFAEGYIKKKWDTTCLDSLLTLFSANLCSMQVKMGLLPKPYQQFSRLRYFLQRNSLSQSRKNISAHYDLGNEFYQLWLDPSMTYSSGIFNDSACSLETAQKNKYHRILSKIEAGAPTLEIGCGWGGFADVAAQAAMPVKGLTISQHQYHYAHERAKAHDTAYRPQIVFQDYRQEKEAYQNIVSIEMFEAVGRKYWQRYFECLKNNLLPTGKAVVQTITIRDDFYKAYARGADFIRTYIFPGGFLPSDQIFRQHAEKAGLAIVESFFFGKDYAKTLRQWFANFQQQKSALLELGYGDEFQRLWSYYLAYCTAGFDQGRTNVCQYVLEHRQTP